MPRPEPAGRRQGQRARLPGYWAPAAAGLAVGLAVGVAFASAPFGLAAGLTVGFALAWEQRHSHRD